jgi:alpha-tubulin suppressor-like RCC1 family protein
VFLTNSGHAFSCGSNKFGQLGTEEDTDEGGGSSDDEGKKAGDEDELDEGMYMPEEIQKRLGRLEKRQDRWQPKKIEIVGISGISGTTKIKYVSVGAMHAFAIIENDNGVVGWGQNTCG